MTGRKPDREDWEPAVWIFAAFMAVLIVVLYSPVFERFVSHYCESQIRAGDIANGTTLPEVLSGARARSSRQRAARGQRRSQTYRMDSGPHGVLRVRSDHLDFGSIPAAAHHHGAPAKTSTCLDFRR